MKIKFVPMAKSKFIILSFIFLIIAVLLSVGYNFYTKKTPLLTLRHDYLKEIITTSRDGKLLAGDKITGEFQSEDNFLGIVEIRFLTYGKVSSDSYIFRMKEKSDKEWYYINTYKAREFGGYPLFPFGFPIIADSKNKKYYFELESLSGRSKDAVGISMIEPVIVVKHVFNREYLLNHKEELALFLFKKVKELSQETNMLYYFIAIYAFLASLLVIKITLPEINVIPALGKLEDQFANRFGYGSKREAYLVSRFFIKLQAIGYNWINKIYKVFSVILFFILRKLYSFHQWLGKE